jgi:hypothetical protein
MKFEPRNFDTWLEDDVREEIISPLLWRLGYKKGTENDILRAVFLKIRYNRNYFGRRKPDKDEYLTGAADYVLEAAGKMRWVIEAKPPNSPITDEEVDQAYHYARHPEVRAVCFCLCKGRELRIYRTDYKPEEALILSLPYERLEDEFASVANILSPQAMLRTWPEVVIDTGRPLGPGLRSFASVTGGHFSYGSSDTHAGMPLLREMLFTVTAGAVQRSEDGGIIAHIVTKSPLQSAQRLNERIGTDKMELSCADEEISADPQRPSVFTSDKIFAIPEGEVVAGFAMPQTITARSETRAEGYLDGSVFKGRFYVLMRMSGPYGAVEVEGPFEINLA